MGVILMTRKAREKSESGIYHIMLRGINKQMIFEDDENKIKFLETLKEYKEKSGYKIYAYCLMGNHVHLLIKECEEEIGIIMRRIGASYVYWYNWKYKRSGHLFQDRYKSEPVEDDSYYLTVLRYIHQNPLKAGLVKNIESYKWSSYNEFTGKKETTGIDFTLKLFHKDREQAIENFKEFHREITKDVCLDIKERKRFTDEEAKELVKKICNITNSVEMQKMNQEERNEYLKRLKNEGLSTRQIARITGISRGLL